jgi:hypothetical protein
MHSMTLAPNGEQQVFIWTEISDNPFVLHTHKASIKVGEVYTCHRHFTIMAEEQLRLSWQLSFALRILSLNVKWTRHSESRIFGNSPTHSCTVHHITNANLQYQIYSSQLPSRHCKADRFRSLYNS